jgi:hypothetical protein
VTISSARWSPNTIARGDAVETATVASLPEEVRGMDVGDGGERAGRGEDPDARLTPARHTNE